MGTPTLSVLRRAGSCDIGERSLGEQQAEFLEVPATNNRAARGALTGILLGVALWVAILTLAGIIKF
jgi:hypothetical protein